MCFGVMLVVECDGDHLTATFAKQLRFPKKSVRSSDQRMP